MTRLYGQKFWASLDPSFNQNTSPTIQFVSGVNVVGQQLNVFTQYNTYNPVKDTRND